VTARRPLVRAPVDVAVDVAVPALQEGRTPGLLKE
jgi:hypothetical protein